MGTRAMTFMRTILRLDLFYVRMHAHCYQTQLGPVYQSTSKWSRAVSINIYLMFHFDVNLLSQVDELTIEDELKSGLGPDDDDVLASIDQIKNVQSIQL